jgi:hypothetical protein
MPSELEGCCSNLYDDIWLYSFIVLSSSNKFRYFNLAFMITTRITSNALLQSWDTLASCTDQSSPIEYVDGGHLPRPPPLERGSTRRHHHEFSVLAEANIAEIDGSSKRFSVSNNCDQRCSNNDDVRRTILRYNDITTM